MRMTIAMRISVLVVLLVVGMTAVLVIALDGLEDNLTADRRDSVVRLVTAARNIVADYGDQAAAGDLTEAEAQAAAARALSSATYGDGDYLFVVNTDGVMLAHPDDALVGKDVIDLADPDGVPIVRDLIAAGQAGGGFVDYAWPRAGSDQPVPKISYAELYGPWNWVISTGIYVDDIQTIFWNQALRIGGIAVAIMVVALVLSVLVARSIIGPLKAITRRMARLAEGDLTIDVPDTDRGDEIGALARALEVFKDSARRMSELQEQQRAAEQAAAEERARTVRGLADQLERDVKAIAQNVAGGSRDVQKTAEDMRGQADQTAENAEGAATSTREADAGVQTVATATEELSASITEITRQVTRAREVTDQAVAAAESTGTQVEGLNAAADKIGEVVDLINNIAGQTNLLALNATIEAARAGEAGKGFAVVAGEVKSLASQTAKATDEIGQQIAQMQAVSRATGTAIGGIGKVIADISEITSAIASAIEEQGAATRDIARNIEHAAQGTSQVSDYVENLNENCRRTGEAARQVHDLSDRMSAQADALGQALDGFLTRIRAG